MSEPGFAEMLGVEVVEWRDNYAEVALDLRRDLRNRSGSAHGGVLVTMLDIACARAGIWFAEGEAPRFASTLSMSVSFMRPGKAGTLRAIGECIAGGRTVFTCLGRVVDEDGKVLALGQGVFRYRPGSERPLPSDAGSGSTFGG